ncbi:hypothetical protein P7C71_g763, partial [Lecanoromycetidae sp. Uapishka_2]
MARPSRQAMYADDPTFLWKLILRISAIPLALIGIGTVACALVTHPIPALAPSTGSTFSFDFQDFVTLPWSFIPLSLSILWNVANVAILLSKNRPVHPGMNVGCDLVLWLFLGVTGTFATFGAAQYIDNSIEGYDDFTDNGGGTYPNGIALDCGSFSSCDAETTYANALQHKGIVITVGVAMEFALVLIHFALFISACRYTHARRYNNSSFKAKAIPAEDNEIARKMVANPSTGSSIQLQPLLQQPQQQAGGAYQPRGQEPIQKHNTAQQQQTAKEQAMQRRYEASASTSSIGKTSSVSVGKGVEQPPPGYV